jgi:heat shock protein HslJ
MMKPVQARTTRALSLLATVAAVCAALTLVACNGAESPSAVTTPSGAGASDGGTRTSVTAPLLGQWKLVSLRPAGRSVLPVPPGTSFSVDFGSDDRVSALADCNRCSSGYTATADALTVGPAMACTRAYCTQSAGYDETYTTLLTLSTTWRVQGTALELQGEAGTLAFTR